MRIKRKKSKKKKFLSLLLCAVMLCGFIPQGMLITSASAAAADDGLCEHHMEHTEDCGYSAGIEGSPCTHEHTEDCYVYVTNCIHTHDESCGYVEAASGSPCTYECSICSEADTELSEEKQEAVAALENMIDEFLSAYQSALENEDGDTDSLESMYEDILAAYEALSAGEQTLVSNYSAFLETVNGTAVYAADIPEYYLKRVEISLDDLETGSPYAVTNKAETQVMSGVHTTDTTTYGSRGFVAEDLSEDYVIWYFEKAGSGDGSEASGYYIYRLENGSKKYLLMNEPYQSAGRYHLDETDDKSSASVFICEIESSQLIMHVKVESENVYLNWVSSGVFRGYTTKDDGSYHSLCHWVEVEVSDEDVYQQFMLTSLTNGKNTTSSLSEIAVADIKTYETTNERYWLIPIYELEKIYGEYGFSFDENKACQFNYRTLKNGMTSTWTSYLSGEYVEYEGDWYLQVTCKDEYQLYIYYVEMAKAEDIVSPSSTVINLFDYWITDNRLDSDNHYTTTAELNAGINANHELKFLRNGNYEPGNLNYSYGGAEISSKATQGIVGIKLIDGYPALSGDTALGITAENYESLAYLFDPKTESEGKASFPNVTGLLSIDSNGYFYYNSLERFAQLDESNNSFTVYTNPAAQNTSVRGYSYGQFFPFNDPHTVALLDSRTDPINHYLGMTLTTRFIQEKGGYTGYTNNQSQRMPITFEFSGDNDVWIFIDGVLVADLGGLGRARSVVINFADGTVKIDDGTETLDTTIRAAFKAAGVEWTNGNSDTFADDTVHTLKFFYLERGNVDSNLKLKFNLVDVPETSIYKVDQYGDKVTGARFAVYPAVYDLETGEYQYADGPDGNAVLLADGAIPDTVTGELALSNGVILSPVYVGVTDADGEMVFVDSDGMPYSSNELKSMFGEYFLLREIDVPDGYRTVTDETLLYFENELLLCADPYGTGVWASPNAQITATNTLYIANNWGNTAIGENGAVNYYDPVTGEITGTLFAVVLKRNGNDTSTEITTEGLKSWRPVYGSNEAGYTVLEFGEETAAYSTLLEAAIAAAQMTQEYGDVAFSYSPSGMQLVMENLPGKATRYYTYMQTHDIAFTETDPQYHVAYYYTTADSVDGANTTNTVRISSHGEEKEGDVTYDAFALQWGSTIEVPNIENRLLFQKLDENGNLIDDAYFALYRVGEDENGAFYYLADDNATHIYLGRAAEDEKGTLTGAAGKSADTSDGTYSIDGDEGVITVEIGEMKYTISPATNAKDVSLVGFTHAECDFVKEAGTGHFLSLLDGYYILREIAAPEGYLINTEEIKVIVNEDAVYANAGTSDNGVSVGNGAGYVMKTLDVFASQGTIDETLTWIYTYLRVNNSTRFSEFSLANDVQYVKQSIGEADGYGDQITSEFTEAMVTYLYYDKVTQTALFDYSPNEDQTARTAALGEHGVATLVGEGTQRLYTTVGWSALEVYQDYDYGHGQTTTGNTTNYDDLTGRNLTHLFSNSTFVQVTDKLEHQGSLTVSKTVSGSGASRTKDFTFTVTLNDETISGTYGDMTFDKGVATFTLKADENKTATNLPADVGYTVVESDNAGYTVTINGTASTTATGTITENLTATAEFDNYKGGGGDDTPDPDPDYGSIKIKKTVQGEKAPAESVEYAFKVWVRNSSGNAVSESVSYAITKEDGTTTTGSATIGTDGYTFYLKHGESITFSGITSGRSVEVQEITTGDFTTTTSGLIDGVCVISPNNTNEVTFINTYGDTPDVPDEPDTPDTPDTPNDVPQTEDTTNIGLWIALACFSLLGMAVSLFGRNRRCKRRS